MARTYKYSDVLGFVGAAFKELTDANGALLCDQTNSMIWNATDWRVSMGALDPFYLSPLEQDYGAPTVSIPCDFLGLRTATLVHTATQPAVRDELNVRRVLPVTNLQGLPGTISYEPAVGKFRVHPCPPQSISATGYMIEGTYKRRPTKVVATGLANTTLPYDDAYVRVFTSGLLYNYFAAKADPRAGTVTVRKGGDTVYGGQLGIFMDALNEMAADEQLNLGDVVIAPTAPLAAPRLSVR